MVLGLTFKENCSDLRNSKVADLVSELREYGCEISVHDPIADPAEAAQEYGIALTHWEKLPKADALVAAVSHREYLEMPIEKIAEKLNPGGLFVDIKSAYPTERLVAARYKVWRL